MARILGTIAPGLALAAGLAFSTTASADAIHCAYPFWPGFAPAHLADALGLRGLQVDPVQRVVTGGIAERLRARRQGRQGQQRGEQAASAGTHGDRCRSVSSW